MKKSKVNLNFLKKKNMKENESNSAVDNNEENESAAIESEETRALTDDTEELTDPVAALEAELSAAKDKYLRLGADFENYKKRINKDRIEMIKMAGADVLVSILPIIDDLERALKAMDDKTDSAAKEG